MLGKDWMAWPPWFDLYYLAVLSLHVELAILVWLTRKACVSKLEHFRPLLFGGIRASELLFSPRNDSLALIPLLPSGPDIDTLAYYVTGKKENYFVSRYYQSPPNHTIFFPRFGIWKCWYYAWKYVKLSCYSFLDICALLFFKLCFPHKTHRL